MSTLKPLVASFWLHCFLLLAIFQWTSSYSSYISPGGSQQQLTSGARSSEANLQSETWVALPTPADLSKPGDRLTESQNKSDDFTLWRHLLYQRWSYPQGLTTLRPAIFFIRLHPQSKKLVSLALSQSSGDSRWDQQIHRQIAETPFDSLRLDGKKPLLKITISALDIDSIEWFQD